MQVAQAAKDESHPRRSRVGIPATRRHRDTDYGDHTPKRDLRHLQVEKKPTLRGDRTDRRLGAGLPAAG